jgi:hypothetical protein
MKYRLLDSSKSAFALFFFLHPLLLDFKRVMKERWKQNNLETWVAEVPRDNQIRTLVDGIEPSVMGEVFERNLRTADDAGIIEGYWEKKQDCEHESSGSCWPRDRSTDGLRQPYWGTISTQTSRFAS